jgi:hypothetical protein
MSATSSRTCGRSPPGRCDPVLGAPLGGRPRRAPAALDGHRPGSTIEVLVLQALAHQERRDMPAAFRSLEQALTLAEPEGCVRVFLDEGPPMLALLRAAAQQGVAHDHARRLVAGASDPRQIVPVQRGLVEPLSSRELEVLRLLRSDLSGPDIVPRAHGVAEHHAVAHQERLLQARCEQPPGSRAPGRPARPVVRPDRTTTSITTCGDAPSPGRFVPCLSPRKQRRGVSNVSRRPHQRRRPQALGR